MIIEANFEQRRFPILPALEIKGLQSGQLMLRADLPETTKTILQTKVVPLCTPERVDMASGHERDVRIVTLPNGLFKYPLRFVIKRSRATILDIRREEENARRTGDTSWHERKPKWSRMNLPLAQFGILETAKLAYRHQYGEELPVENLLAGYTDRETGYIYTIFEYAQQPPMTPDAEEKRLAFTYTVWGRLHHIGITGRGNQLGFVTGDEKKNVIAIQTKRGRSFLLIDIEYWKFSPNAGLIKSFLPS